MKLLCLLMCITYVSCFYTDLKPSNKEKIFGGEPVKYAVYAPYQANVHNLDELLGGAVIISKDCLLSAEKIFKNVVNVAQNVRVRTGSLLRQTSSFFGVASVTKYSAEYPGSDVDTNLALIWLNKPLVLNDVQQAVRRLNQNAIPQHGSMMKILGYGKLDESMPRPSNMLMEAEVEVLKSEDCPVASKRLFCAKTPGKDVCHGDEGGPGVIDDELFAIITGKPNCGNGNAPGIYSNVGYFYKWIQSKISN